MSTTTTKRLSFSDNAKLGVAATGAVLALDQVEHAIDDEEDKLGHAIKAAIGAAVAIGAWELLRGDDKASSKQPNGQPKPKPKPKPKTGSGSPQPKHHDIHLAEEVIGAYALGRELLGDRKHHIADLVGEAIGATGLLQELAAKEEAYSKHKS